MLPLLSALLGQGVVAWAAVFVLELKLEQRVRHHKSVTKSYRTTSGMLELLVELLIVGNTLFVGFTQQACSCN